MMLYLELKRCLGLKNLHIPRKSLKEVDTEDNLERVIVYPECEVGTQTK
jgi:hypothetical protein